MNEKTLERMHKLMALYGAITPGVAGLKAAKHLIGDDKNLALLHGDALVAMEMLEQYVRKQAE